MSYLSNILAEISIRIRIRKPGTATLLSTGENTCLVAAILAVTYAAFLMNQVIGFITLAAGLYLSSRVIGSFLQMHREEQEQDPHGRDREYDTW